ncbi:MAG: 50S ribosomal protein L7/L12, partial [Planctomycetes bacterium]|nr:50S ribosomal protein L7/L12 [Planctomycetota bacterium]
MIELEPELMTIVEKLDGLTLIQASKVVKHLEARWGVSAAAPVAVAAAPAAGAAA